MNRRLSFWKIAGLALAIQIILGIVLWISALVFSADFPLLILVYFYWPTMRLAIWLGIQGEVGPFMFGIMWGSVVYSIVLGTL